MDPLTKLLEPVPGALRWVQGEREPDLQKIYEDDTFLAPLSSGERARVYLFTQLYNGYLPALLKDEGWDLGKAAAALDQDGQVSLVHTLQRLWGVAR
jgi:hypothetical protein